MGYEVEGRWHLNQGEWACNLSTQEKGESQLRVPSNRRWIPCLTENKHRKKPRLHLLINPLDEFRNMIQMYTKAKATNPSKKSNKGPMQFEKESNFISNWVANLHQKTSQHLAGGSVRQWIQTKQINLAWLHGFSDSQGSRWCKKR